MGFFDMKATFPTVVVQTQRNGSPAMCLKLSHRQYLFAEHMYLLIYSWVSGRIFLAPFKVQISEEKVLHLDVTCTYCTPQNIVPSTVHYINTKEVQNCSARRYCSVPLQFSCVLKWPPMIRQIFCTFNMNISGAMFYLKHGGTPVCLKHTLQFLETFCLYNESCRDFCSISMLFKEENFRSVQFNMYNALIIHNVAELLRSVAAKSCLA